jgi:ankyrin repeat protein
MSLVSAFQRGLLCALSLVVGCAWAIDQQHTMTASNQFFSSGPEAALEVAIRANDAFGLSRALSGGAAVNMKGRFEVTPLMIAVDVQNLAAVEALLNAGALPNAKAADRNGPVSLAAKSYQARPHGREILAAVIKAGGDPDSRQPNGDPVLMQFVLAHDADGLKLMKALGANLDVRDKGGDPFITNIAMSQDWDMVWALIELGAAYDYEHTECRQPLSKALTLRYPAPDSPLYPYKLKVWQFLKDKGIAVKPMQP